MVWKIQFVTTQIKYSKCFLKYSSWERTSPTELLLFIYSSEKKGYIFNDGILLSVSIWKGHPETHWATTFQDNFPIMKQAFLFLCKSPYFAHIVVEGTWPFIWENVRNIIDSCFVCVIFSGKASFRCKAKATLKEGTLNQNCVCTNILSCLAFMRKMIRYGDIYFFLAIWEVSTLTQCVHHTHTDNVFFLRGHSKRKIFSVRYFKIYI